MVLVGCAIFPHGSMVLDPNMPGLPKHAKELHDACVACASKIKSLEPDVIVLTTPHGFTLSSSMGIYLNGTAAGNADWLGKWDQFKVNVKIDKELSTSLWQHLTDLSLPAEMILTYSGSGPIQLRWAEVVPLWFLQNCFKNEQRFIILTTPAPIGSSSVLKSPTNLKRVPFNLTLGEGLEKFYQSCSQRIVHVVSGDLAHTHGCEPTLDTWFLPHFDSPSTLDPWYQPEPQLQPQLKHSAALVPTLEAKLFDEAILKWVKELNAQVLVEEAAGLVGKALACGFDGILLLHGIIKNNLGDFSSEALYCANPTYYGMIVAFFERKKHHPNK